MTFRPKTRGGDNFMACGLLWALFFLAMLVNPWMHDAATAVSGHLFDMPYLPWALACAAVQGYWVWVWEGDAYDHRMRNQ